MLLLVSTWKTFLVRGFSHLSECLYIPFLVWSGRGAATASLWFFPKLGTVWLGDQAWDFAPLFPSPFNLVPGCRAQGPGIGFREAVCLLSHSQPLSASDYCPYFPVGVARVSCRGTRSKEEEVWGAGKDFVVLLRMLFIDQGHLGFRKMQRMGVGRIQLEAECLYCFLSQIHL